MSDFHLFSRAVADRFDAMSKHELFVVDATSLWEVYLSSFPEGTNPIYRERTEHDCSCCKHFVRNIGHVVALIDGKRVSVWDVEVPEPYATVARRLSEIAHQMPIKSVYRTKERSYGAEKTAALIDGSSIVFHHFHAKIDRAHLSSEPDTARSEMDAIAQVFRRGLTELKIDAMTSVLDLIKDNAIYRGAEFKESVEKFLALKRHYDVVENKEAFIWSNLRDRNARFRNTVIGTLITDLSDGVDLEDAVKMFESKVGPTKCKRPKALITQRMVDDAAKKLAELGLETALERRFARMSDVSVNNVLWVNNDARSRMKDGIAGLLAKDVKQPALDVSKAADTAVPISIGEFLETVAPRASSMELLLRNDHMGNFMSLTAPVHADVQPLFKWDNNFAWAYDGDVTDSIKQRVKRAGGNVDAILRVSLGWYNKDDLDLHVIEPNGNRIYYANKIGRTGGQLDVDMNAWGNYVRDAVENIRWLSRVQDGVYLVEVNNFNRREAIDQGFTLEVDFRGKVQHFTFDKDPGREKKCLKLHVKDGVLVDVVPAPGLLAASASNEKWGVHTETFVPVETLLASPNHWDDQSVGNKHWFFILKDCRNPADVRGFYNEFLRSSLEPHRKVFELLGARTKCEPSPDQLSGVGFSTTLGARAVVAVKGEVNRIYDVHF